jgi:flagellar basal-body rod protein FlgF
MDKMIHTALHTMHATLIQQNVGAQNMANSNVPGFRSDQIGGSFGSLYLSAENQLQSRAFVRESEAGLFSDEQGQIKFTGEQTDLAIKGKGYFMVENVAGKMSFSRRGDFVRGMEGYLLNGVGQKMLDTSLVPIEVPPFKKIFVSESGQIYIQPVGAEPNTRVLINQIALNSDSEDNIIKDIDGELRPKDGFDRETFNPDQNALLQQGYLEESNVNVFEELVQNTELMKRFQLNTKLISIAKDLDESSASLLRMPNG